MSLLIQPISFAAEEENKEKGKTKPKPVYKYVSVEPFVITNFVKDNGNLGFINVEPSIMVLDKHDENTLNRHIPIVKDYFIFMLGSLDESTIKDYKQRNKILQRSKKELQKLFIRETGKPVVQGVLFEKYITQ